MKKEINRMCIVCREMKDKRSLLRVVKNKNQEIFIDDSMKADGRGAYICKDKDCIEKLCKTKALNRVFKTNVNESIYLDIQEVVLGKK